MSRSSYHHGDLRRVLIETTSDVIASEGTGGFTLRKIAKLASVSASAPSHHFGDSRGLLTAVAGEGFRLLVEAFESIDQSLAPYERLIAHGRAYVSLGVDHPGYMAVMFRDDLLDLEDETYRIYAPRSFELISTAVSEAIDNVGSGLDPVLTTKTVWAACHGIVNLYETTADRLEEDAELLALVDNTATIILRKPAP